MHACCLYCDLVHTTYKCHSLFFFEDKFPPNLTVPLSLKSSLRYGENPHQKAAFYVDKSLSEVNAGGIATAIQHHGKVKQLNYLGLHIIYWALYFYFMCSLRLCPGTWVVLPFGAFL